MECTSSGPRADVVGRVPYSLPMSVDFQQVAIFAAPKAAAVANFCDHVEHNEPAETAWVIDAANELRQLALDAGTRLGVNLIELYAERLGGIEARNVLGCPGGFDGHGAALAADTWRELQLVQIEHDRFYHADVVSLSKAEQLRHYALHLTKIVGAFAEPRGDEELVRRRLPDTLLFALKLHTVMGERLSSQPLPRDAAHQPAFATSV